MYWTEHGWDVRNYIRVHVGRCIVPFRINIYGVDHRMGPTLLHVLITDMSGCQWNKPKPFWPMPKIPSQHYRYVRLQIFVLPTPSPAFTLATMEPINKPTPKAIPLPHAIFQSLTWCFVRPNANLSWDERLTKTQTHHISTVATVKKEKTNKFDPPTTSKTRTSYLRCILSNYVYESPSFPDCSF